MSAEQALDLSGLLKAAREQCRAGAGTVLDVLLRISPVGEAQMLASLAEQSGVHAMLNASGWQPDFEHLDRAHAREWRCVVLVAGGSGELSLAAADPWDHPTVQRIVRKVGRQLRVVAVTQELLTLWLSDKEIEQKPREAEGATVQASGPVVSFVDQALQAGYRNGASDVHFETDRAGVSAKHRLDGVLRAFARLDGYLAAQEVISRIKVMAQLDITERRLPQDGRCRFDVGGQEVDVRVSIMPSVHGEDAVLRILDKARRQNAGGELTLQGLGFNSSALESIRELAHFPSGMLLITGPTGSGKTTTVYAALSEINNGQEKIITIEDPVEYELQGVLQIPVNERKGLTFARGLRSILRHDPDRILVGEIRDAETAEIAVQSALTGHLVFTTVHANSMADVVGRFRHFGLDMFGFMSSLNGVVVQRLVRQLCPVCAGWRGATAAEVAWLHRWEGGDASRVSRAIGCVECQQTGYRGRFVIAEVHVVDDALRDRVTEGASMSVIRAHAGVHGSERLAAISARAVLDGRTTIEEVRRVVGWY